MSGFHTLLPLSWTLESYLELSETNSTAKHSLALMSWREFCALHLLCCCCCLIHNADDLDRSDERKDLVSKLSYQMAIDLFDVVDMIDIVLEDKRHGSANCSCANVTVNETQPTVATSSLNTIPESFGIVMITVASLSLLMSLWQLFENKLSRHDTKIRFRATVLRNLVEIALVNFVFLVIRLVVYAEYRRNESIFIAKNIISIVLSILEINAHCESHSVKFWSELCKSCFGLRGSKMASSVCCHYLLSAKSV